jgi:hypothetical protein
MMFAMDERGGKPEYFGVTELEVPFADVTTRRHLASGERLYTSRMFTLPVDISALGDELRDGVDLLETRACGAYPRRRVAATSRRASGSSAAQFWMRSGCP